MKKILALMAITLIATSCRENPFLREWNTKYSIPEFNKIQTSDYIPAIKEGIRIQNEEIDAIISNPEPATFENTIVALDRSGKLLSRTTSVLMNLNEADTTPELGTVVEQVMPLISDHYTSINMNVELFNRVKAVYDKEIGKLEGEKRMLLKNTYESFVKNGVGLDDCKRNRLKEINSELSTLALKFGNNLLAESNAFKSELGIPVSNYYSKMAQTEDRALREKMFRMYSNRANNGNQYDNKAIVLREMELRIEKAKILGFSSPAEMILQDQMASSPEIVDKFLRKIMDAAMRRAKEEIADMQKLMDKDISNGLLEVGSRIEPWDYMYYQERIRKSRYDLDEKEVMNYFKMENVRTGVFLNAQRLYGITFEPLKDAVLYHPECEAFKVLDSDSSLIGVIITDYFPRSSKRAGAWMDNLVPQYIDVDGKDVRPVIVNVGNFNRPTDSLPSLLTIDQVSTLFHEFGHALHGLLSKCNYVGTSGTNVKRDFVELPSQINENWAFQPQALATYAFHYKTGEVIPQELVEKVISASNFNQGFITGELCAASILDMKWHELQSIEGVSVEEFEKKVCSEMGLHSEIIPRYRSTYFNHIFGSSGYSAGYYSYLWAEVLDKDAFELFKQNGVYDPQTALSFRHNILEKGGSEEPMELYRRFRGAEPDSEALLRARGLK